MPFSHGFPTAVSRSLLLIQCAILTYNRQNFEKLLVVGENFTAFVSFITDRLWRNGLRSHVLKIAEVSADDL